MWESGEILHEQPIDGLDLSKSLLIKRLREYDLGLRKVNLRDIIAIRAALLAERPTVDHLLTVILNEFEFLTNEFTLHDGEKQETVMRFLNEFKTSMQRELLLKSGTFKDGLALSDG